MPRRAGLLLVSLAVVVGGAPAAPWAGSRARAAGAGAASAAKRIGAPGARGFRRSPDGARIAWLEPGRGEGAEPTLVEYRAGAGTTRTVDGVVEFSYGPTGELAVVRQAGPGGARELAILGDGASAPGTVVGAAERWWLGPGGAGAAERGGAVVVWGGSGVPATAALRPPLEVVAAERTGRFRLVLRETGSGGSAVALGGDGRLVPLARGARAVAVAASGDAVAVAGCGGADEVCIWRGEASSAERVRAPAAARLQFDAAGTRLAILAGAAAPRALLLAREGGRAEVLGERVVDFAWAAAEPLLVWRSEGEDGGRSGVKRWAPDTGVVALECGAERGGADAASVSPDGRTVACLARAPGSRAGVLRVGPASGQGAFARVSESAVAFGFSPAGDVLWLLHTCARAGAGCALAVAPVAAGAAGRPERLSGLATQVRFDDRRSDRILFDADLHGWEILVRDGGHTERLGELDWSDVALLPAGQVAFLRKGADAGVFVAETGRPGARR